MEVEPSEVASRGDWQAEGTGVVCPGASGGFVGGGAMEYLG